MTLDVLIDQSSHSIIALEQVKNHRFLHEQIRRRALDAAAAEAQVYEAERAAGASGQDLAITLISQASCLVDASQIKEALQVFDTAYYHAETVKLKAWIQQEVATIQAMMVDIPNYQFGHEHEYRFVERPFLDQLSALGWQIIDQGLGIPYAPQASQRDSFGEVVLKRVFKREIQRINQDEHGQSWLNDQQLDLLYALVTEPRLTGSPGLLEINEYLFGQLLKNHPLPDEQGIMRDAWLIDFKAPQNNHFLAVNQFRIDTPHGVKKFIIPDLVLFVNGIPLVVIECKEAGAHSANPMHDAFRQLQRYSEQRETTRQAGLREGEVKLFYTNLLMIRTTGEQTDYGTITANETHYFPWKSIYPEQLRQYQPPLGRERAQERLIQGMLAKQNLIDLLRCCTLFMDIGTARSKVVARYQQFRAMQKIVDRLRTKAEPKERSGVVWHTQGSGKSLTMVFIIRKLRASEDLKDYKVILVNDRLDLEQQLAQTVHLTGESGRIISKLDEVQRLESDSSDLNLVMIHKFQTRTEQSPAYFEPILRELPFQYQNLGTINPSDRILIMVDEAHRSQYSELGDNLFEAFPHATKLAFTGTPIIKDEKRQTTRRFGTYIDEYRLQNAVDDGATLKIIYEGRAADVAISRKSVFEERFIDLCKDYTAEEMALIRRRYGTTGDILEAEQRIADIARDLVDHYIEHILPNGFKAQVVCSSKVAAVRYEREIQRALQRRLEKEHLENPEALLTKQVAFLKTAVVLSQDDDDTADIVDARNRSRSLNAVENFKRPFNFDEPERANTGVAFLIVCDMLLTGFDAPIEQVMYIDKKIRHHNLLQSIARVNRTAKGKSRGFIVDYVGLANHLREALAIYESDEIKDVHGNLASINDEFPILERRYLRLVQLFQDRGINHIEDVVKQTADDLDIQYNTVEAAIACLEDIRLRADFEVFLKNFLESLDIILPDSIAAAYRIPARQFGYILARTKQRYKDDSLSLEGIGEKVRKLISEHLISLGINPKIEPVELFSADFIEALDRNRNPRAKASEMEHALRKHCEIHFDEDPALYSRFIEKIEAIVRQYADNWDAQLDAFTALADEVQQGRQDTIEGLTAIETTIFERIAQIAFGDEPVPDQYRQLLAELSQQVIRLLRSRITIVNFWQNNVEVERLIGSLDELLILSDVDPVESKADILGKELASLAKTRQTDIVAA